VVCEQNRHIDPAGHPVGLGDHAVVGFGALEGFLRERRERSRLCAFSSQAYRFSPLVPERHFQDAGDAVAGGVDPVRHGDVEPLPHVGLVAQQADRTPRSELRVGDPPRLAQQAQLRLGVPELLPDLVELDHELEPQPLEETNGSQRRVNPSGLPGVQTVQAEVNDVTGQAFLDGWS
jgi:hypothetical protein